MHPACTRALQNTRNQRGARCVEHAALAGVAKNLVVRGDQRTRQKCCGVFNQRARFFLIQRRNSLQCQLSCHFTFRVAAHAICQHKKTRLPRVAIAHAVFVFFPASSAAYLKD